LTDKAGSVEAGTAGQNRASWDPNRVPEQRPWALKWHIPGFLARLVPLFVIRGVREIKGRALSRDFPRHLEFAQSPEDRQASASMSIVVAIHDAPRVTRRCLASLEKYAAESEIILVDDGSKRSETLDLIRRSSVRNGWKVVRHEKSLGHSEACRAGAELATRPYLCLLNSDTVVTPWCWRRVKEVLEQDQNIGIAGPSTCIAATSQVLSLAENLGAYWNESQICVFANRLLTQLQEPVVVDLEWVSGFAFFIRRNLWNELGGFDPELPDYGNEFELCSRVAEKGCRVVWIRDSYIHHFGGESYGTKFGEEGIREQVRAADAYIKRKKRSSLP
jgi:GT2 family glycosyltransferase